MAFADAGGLRDTLVNELLARGGKKKANGSIEFKCHRHDDGNASAFLGDGAWGCLACGFSEPFTSLASDLGVPVSNDYTLDEYAAEKGFNAEKLMEWGLYTMEDPKGAVVAIPYYDETGAQVRTKMRLRGSRHFWSGRGIKPFIYGVNRLNGAKRVLLVEGESDCHAAWHHDVPAVGIPGANAWRSEWKHYLEGREVFVWQEPDKGGQAFVASVARDLPTAKVIRPDGTKDLADLHKKVGGEFRSEVNRLAKTAVPITAPNLRISFDPMLGESLRSLLDRKLRPIDSVPTSFPTLNGWCRDEGGGVGFARGWHTILAAATGTGKSVGGANLAYAAALSGERVTYITLEMSQHQLQTRQLAIMSGIPIRMLEQGSSFDMNAFNEAVRRVHEIHEQTGGFLLINRTPIRQLSDIVDSIKYNHEVHGSRFFITDYIQLARVAGADDIYSRITKISDTIMDTMVQLDVTGVGLSQFNRDTTASGERPSKSGLKGGSSLEDDAHIVMLFYVSEKKDDPRTGMETELDMTLIIDKNRHGPKGDIPIRFDKTTLRMRERLPDEEASWSKHQDAQPAPQVVDERPPLLLV